MVSSVDPNGIGTARSVKPEQKHVALEDPRPVDSKTEHPPMEPEVCSHVVDGPRDVLYHPRDRERSEHLEDWSKEVHPLIS